MTYDLTPACIPARLHAFSRLVLDLYLAGRMPTSEFRRWFHMPNSDYLPLSDRIAQIVDPEYVAEGPLMKSCDPLTPDGKSI
ncbi:MAG: hypothetical protein KDK89_04735 [Alphaproteobacteria bacterium]|nr:hypothetical protein [Alphaproteobacteria bacterium]